MGAVLDHILGCVVIGDVCEISFVPIVLGDRKGKGVGKTLVWN